MNLKPRQGLTLRDTKSNLLEAAQAAVADQRTKARAAARSARRRGGERTPFRAVLLMVIIAGALLLIERPSWLTGPQMPAETAEIKAASATLSLVDAMSRVNAYLDRRGRLPPTLRDAGVTNPAIQYQMQSEEHFTLTLRTTDSTVTVTSTDSLKSQVVDAIRAIQRRT